MPHPTTMFVKPAADLKVLVPGVTREYLPDRGMLVPRNGYWLRRLKDGDVTEVKQGASASVVSQTANPEPAPEPAQETGKTGKGKKE